MSNRRAYFELDPSHTDPARIKKEREKARKLKNSQWWKSLLQRGVCHYCEKKFSARELTMDHVVPLARGGTSAPGNIVPACRSCNQEKKLEMPVDRLFEQLEAERAEKGESQNSDDDSDSKHSDDE